MIWNPFDFKDVKVGTLLTFIDTSDVDYFCVARVETVSGFQLACTIQNGKREGELMLFTRSNGLEHSFRPNCFLINQRIPADPSSWKRFDAALLEVLQTPIWNHHRRQLLIEFFKPTDAERSTFWTSWKGPGRKHNERQAA